MREIGFWRKVGRGTFRQRKDGVKRRRDTGLVWTIRLLDSVYRNGSSFTRLGEGSACIAHAGGVKIGPRFLAAVGPKRPDISTIRLCAGAVSE
jgi:hypothetical protein